MKITLDLVAGLPKKELVERIHYHQRQGEIAERALDYRPLGPPRGKFARIARADTEQVWLAAARRMTCRELEAEVSGKKGGDPPGCDAEGPGALRRAGRAVRPRAAWPTWATGRPGIRQVDAVG